VKPVTFEQALAAVTAVRAAPAAPEELRGRALSWGRPAQ
jgi:hypothetical protein